MRITQLSPGTGSYYCGACLRDQTLARAMIRRGHAMTLLPLYLPHFAEDPAAAGDDPVLMGAVSVYLQHRIAPLRWLPGPVHRLLAAPRLLRWAGRRGGGTDPASLGPLTVATLRGGAGPLGREAKRLVAAIRRRGPAPDVVGLSNVLLSGLAGELRRQLRVPVVGTLQGETPFLDALAPPYRERAWALLAERAAEVDLFIAVSRHHAARMQERLGLPPDRIRVVWNGVEVAEEAAPPPGSAAPTIGYLARIDPANGLSLLVEAFLDIRARGAVPNLRLRIAGVALDAGRRLLADLRERIAAAGASAEVDFLPDLAERDKSAFLRSLSVLSVPASADESFGLYVLEALAEGVPVVQPRRAPFDEIVAATQGGLLCDPDSPAALATALERLLRDPAEARRLGASGRSRVRESFTSDHMAAGVEAAFTAAVAKARSARP